MLAHVSMLKCDSKLSGPPALPSSDDWTALSDGFFLWSCGLEWLTSVSYSTRLGSFLDSVASLSTVQLVPARAKTVRASALVRGTEAFKHVYVSICLSVYLSVCVCLSIYQSIFCLSISIYVSLYLSTYLTIYLFM